jgi:frataxin-like iron-binding protein CyaY
MKVENSDNNGFDLDEGNILKSTFDTLTEEGHQVFEAYIDDLRELFLSHCEVTRQGTVLQDTTPIIFNKLEVIPEVWLDPSSSHNDIQFMIDSALERQAKNTDEMLCRLTEERDGKKFDTTSVNLSSTCTVSFINPHISDPSADGTSMPNPSTQPVNHCHS